jgi:hypothetical protein
MVTDLVQRLREIDQAVRAGHHDYVIRQCQGAAYWLERYEARLKDLEATEDRLIELEAAMANDESEEDGWENVSSPPHKPYHIQKNAEGVYRYKTTGEKWQYGEPPVVTLQKDND